MGTTSDAFTAIINDLKGKITTNATALGFATTVVVSERDEDPAVVAELGQLPKAYVIPIVEGQDDIDFTMGGPEFMHKFPITVYAYYLGSGAEDTSGLDTDVVNLRTYAMNFIDIFRAGDYCNQAQLIDGRLDLGYAILGGRLIYTWIWKLTFTAII